MEHNMKQTLFPHFSHQTTKQIHAIQLTQVNLENLSFKIKYFHDTSAKCLAYQKIKSVLKTFIIVF